MRLIAEMGRGWWLPETTVLWYPLALILPFGIEFAAINGHEVGSSVLFGILLFLHEFLVAREIEHVRPYSAISFGKTLAHIEEAFTSVATGCVRIAKYTLIFGLVPIVILRSHGPVTLWVYIGLASAIVLVGDTVRIVGILRQLLFSEQGRPYVRILTALVASYASFILAFTMLYTALYRLRLGLFTGLHSPLATIDFLYFNTITFTTLGYGDITPISWPLRLVVAAENIISYLLFAFTIGAVVDFKRRSDNAAPPTPRGERGPVNDRGVMPLGAVCRHSANGVDDEEALGRKAVLLIGGIPILIGKIANDIG